MAEPIDRELLEDWLAQGMSLPEIGRFIGRPSGTVGYWVRRHGLEANGREKFSPGRRAPRDDVARLLDSGATLAEIGKVYGVAPSTVRNWIDKYELAGTRATQRIELIRAARKAGERVIVLECAQHGPNEHVIYSAGAWCRRCNSAGVAKRRRRVKEILVQEAGGKCLLCGYDRVPRALHFHHLDPSQKDFGLGLGGVTRSIATIRQEAAKCVLLCSNCHCEVEEGVVELSVG